MLKTFYQVKELVFTIYLSNLQVNEKVIKTKASMKNIFIVGSGGFAQEVLYILDRQNKYSAIRAFLEPDKIWESKFKDRSLLGIDVLPYSDLNRKNSEVYIAVGRPDIRKKITGELGEKINYPKLIDPDAKISRWSKLGEGAIITAGCVVTTSISIGNHCHLNLNSTIGHDCQIGDFFTSAPSVNISGQCIIRNQVYFGTGAATRQGVSICNNVTVGMGAMVVKDISEVGTYIGIPAKKIN